MLSVSKKIIPGVKRKGQGGEAKAARRTDVSSAPRDAVYLVLNSSKLVENIVLNYFLEIDISIHNSQKEKSNSQ